MAAPDPLTCRVLAPSAAELLAPGRPAICPEPSCTRKFSNTNALYLHVTRHHLRQPLRRRIPAEDGRLLYICPAEQCPSARSHFSSFKALKQHYLKLHAQKTHRCSECGSAVFATPALLRAHQKSCHVRYGCECGAVYAHKATLAHHARRHRHRLLLTVQRSVCPESAASEDRLDVLASVALDRRKRPAAVVVGRASQTALSVATAGRVAAETQTVSLRSHWDGHRTGDVLLSERQSEESAATCRQDDKDANVTAVLGIPTGGYDVTNEGRSLAPELLSAHTQTMYSFDDIEHLLLPTAGDAPDSGTGDLPLFPELSSIDCYTQTPWRLDDDQLGSTAR